MHVLLTTCRSHEDIEPVVGLAVQFRTLGGEARV
jgi:hypothetical protein